MRSLFVDTSQIVASLHPHDYLHPAAIALDEAHSHLPLVTSDFVIMEVLNYFSEFRNAFKYKVALSIEVFYSKRGLTIVECSRSLLIDGIQLYKSRLDKGYSLTDCISMNLMRDHGITEVMTNDSHFSQEGFRILL